MNDNLTTNTSNEAESPAFLVDAVMRCSNGHDFFQRNILMQDTLVKRGRNGDIMRERDYVCPICKVKIDTRYVVWENIA